MDPILANFFCIIFLLLWLWNARNILTEVYYVLYVMFADITE